MADSIQDLEYQKFRTVASGKAVAVVSSGDTSGLLAGLSYDDIQVTDLGFKDHYSYYLSTALVATIEVEYEDSTKEKLVRVRRV